LEIDRPVVEYLARLLAEHRVTLGTRRGRRALGPFRHAVLVIRWFLDDTRVRQPARDSQISRSSAYKYLHEGLLVLAAQAPDLDTAGQAARDAGHTHLNLDGTLIYTDRCAHLGPNGADLWWSGKHKHHGGNIQVLCAPDGWPRWVADVRPRREHDTTCAKAADGLIAGLEHAERQAVPTLTDLGYINLSPAIRHPFKKPKGGELTGPQKTYNKILRGIHGPAERANCLLKTTFKALRHVSLDPWKIGRITKAALVLLQQIHNRTA
jgi:hypothetical protein